MPDDYLRQNSVRLLREEWKTAGELSRELYQLFSDRPPEALSPAAPPAVAARALQAAPEPLPLEVDAQAAPSGVQPRTRPQGGHGVGVAPADTDRPEKAGFPISRRPPIDLALRGKRPAGTAAPAPSDSQSAGKHRPRESMPVEPIRKKPYTMASPWPDVDFPVGGLGGGDSLQAGKVVDETAGPNIQVALYPDGSLGAAGDTITVHIAQLLDTETIPAGTWIDCIRSHTTAGGEVFYEAQVPIWMA